MRNARTAGYTLTEAMIVLSILAIILGSAITAVKEGQDHFNRSVTSSVVNTKITRAVNRIAKRLTAAGRDSVFPWPTAPLGSDSISFQEVVAWNGSSAVWSEDVDIRLEYEPGELDNGLDDDDDGMVDECRVVLIENVGEADERNVVLISSVREFLAGEIPNGLDDNGNGLEDERGLCFEAQGNTLVVRLSVMRRDQDRRITLQTLETRVGVRN